MLLAMNGGLKMGLCNCRGSRVVGAFVPGLGLAEGLSSAPQVLGSGRESGGFWISPNAGTQL